MLQIKVISYLSLKVYLEMQVLVFECLVPHLECLHEKSIFS